MDDDANANANADRGCKLSSVLDGDERWVKSKLGGDERLVFSAVTFVT